MLISSGKISLFLKNEGPYMHKQALQTPRQLLPMFKPTFTWCRRVTWDYWCGKRRGTKSYKKSPGSLCFLAWELHLSTSTCSLPELPCVDVCAPCCALLMLTLTQGFPGLTSELPWTCQADLWSWPQHKHCVHQEVSIYPAFLTLSFPHISICIEEN